MSIKKRNILSIIMVLCIVIGSMMPCFAYGENIADLTKTMKWKFSESKFGPNTRAYIIKGVSENSKSSEHSVYFINAVYTSSAQADNKSSYAQDTLRLVAKDSELASNVPSSYFSDKRYFRLLLNPYGENTTGCKAHGVQRDSN